MDGSPAGKTTCWSLIKGIGQILDGVEGEDKTTTLEKLKGSIIKRQETVPEEPKQTPESTSPSDSVRIQDLAEALTRKDFKIQGQIGEPGQRDRLSFAITLPQLRRILRAHYKERGALELYQELMAAVQSPRESSHDFLIRTMDLRQKVLFASQEDKTTLQYDAQLVRDTFFQALMTGFEESVRVQMQPYLEATSTTDEELLERLNIAMNRDQRRQQKRNTKVIQVKPVLTESKEPTGSCSKDHPKTDPAWKTEMDELKREMRQLKDMIKNNQVAAQARPRRPDSEWGCSACRQEGLGRACRHCFKCGGDGHRARECMTTKSGNEEGLPTRGVE